MSVKCSFLFLCLSSVVHLFFSLPSLWNYITVNVCTFGPRLFKGSVAPWQRLGSNQADSSVSLFRRCYIGLRIKWCIVEMKATVWLALGSLTVSLLPLASSAANRSDQTQTAARKLLQTVRLWLRGTLLKVSAMESVMQKVCHSLQ